MNFRFLFLALSLVAGGNALRFGSGAKSGVKENAGIDLLTVCAGMTTIKDTMTSQGCFFNSWSTNDTLFHTQLETMCANCTAATHYTSLKALATSCLDSDPELVKDVAMAAAACATKTGSSVLCAEPIVREIKLGASGPKNKTVLEAACGGTSCPTEYIAALVANTAHCNAEVDSLALMHYCLKDGDTYCYEDFSKAAEWEGTAKYDTFCKAPCSKKFYDLWNVKSADNAVCYANQSLPIKSDLYCRVASNGTNCLDMIKTYTPDPHATCTTQMGADEGTWSYCNDTCKTQMETLFTDLGCCAETYVQQKVDNEKDGVAATKWLKDTCSIATADTVCALDVYTPPVVTTVKPSVNTTTAKPDMGNKTTAAPKNTTSPPTTEPSPKCDKCEKESAECEKVDDCFTMIMGCYAEVDTEKFTKCVKPLGFDESSAGFHEAVELLECHYCKCEDDKAAKDICKGYAEPTPEDTTPSAANKISLIAVMFVVSVVSLSTLKFF